MTTLKARRNSELPTAVIMVNDKAACNIACTHCYLPYDGSRKPKDTLNLVKHLRTNYRVIIAGSEALMDLDYLEAYAQAGQNYILTNGILLDQRPEIFDYLNDAGIEEIRLSLHFGIQKDLKSVPEKIIARVVAEARKRAFKTQIATTVTTENCKDVGAMCDQTYAIGADSIQFFKYVKSGSARGEKRQDINPEQRIKLFELVDQARKKYSPDELSIKMHGNFGPKHGTKGETLAECNEYCPAGEKLFVIDPDDKVYGCPLLMEHPIGSLAKGGRIEVSRNLCGGNRSRCLTDEIL